MAGAGFGGGSNNPSFQFSVQFSRETAFLHFEMSNHVKFLNELEGAFEEGRLDKIEEMYARASALKFIREKATLEELEWLRDLVEDMIVCHPDNIKAAKVLDLTMDD